MVASLTLLDAGVQADHKEHLALVLVGQQEEPQHRGVGDLVVEGLAVEVQEGGVDADVVVPCALQYVLGGFF